MNKPTFTKLCLIIITLLFSSYCNIAQPAKLKFGISSSAGYYRVSQSDGYKNDFAYLMLSPNAILGLASYKSSISSQIRASISQYRSESHSNLQNLNFSLNGQYNPLNRLSFILRETLFLSGQLKATETITEENLEYITTTYSFVSNNFNQSIGYRLKSGKTSLSLGYSNVITKYEENIQSWNTHAAILQLRQSLMDKISAQVGCQLVRKQYGEYSDYFSIPLSLAIKQKLGNRIDTSISIGLENRGYIGSDQGSNWTKPTIGVNATGKISTKANSYFSFQRSFSDSFGASKYSVIRTSLYSGLNMQLGRAAQLTINPIYVSNDYLGIERKLKYFGITIMAQYNFTKLGSIALNYGYNKRKNDIGNSQYDYHTVYTSYSITF